jgi:hypothetical protein
MDSGDSLFGYAYSAKPAALDVSIWVAPFVVALFL